MFQPLARDKFPCLDLAYEACRKGGTWPTVLNAANESAVEAFLNRRIAFIEIPRIIEQALVHHQALSHPALEDVLAADEWTRSFARETIGKK